MWLPNALTLIRIPLGIAFFFVVQIPWLALTVLLFGAFTDLIDGTIARAIRRRRGEPPYPPGGGLGAWLDPLCDKFFVLSVLLGILFVLKADPRWLLLIGVREWILVPLAGIYAVSPWVRRRMRYNFTAGVPGKLATVAQIVALGALLTRQPSAPVWALLAGAIGLVAAVFYIRRGILLMRESNATAV